MVKVATLFIMFFAFNVRAQTTEGSSTMTVEAAAPAERVERATRSDYFYLPEAKHSVVSLSYGKVSEKYDADLLNYDGEGTFDRVRVSESASEYNLDLKFSLTKNVFASASSFFRSSVKNFSRTWGSGSYDNNDVSDYRGQIGYFSRHRGFNVLTSVSGVYIPRSGQTVREGMAVIPQLGFESQLSGGVMGMKIQQEVVVQKPEHLQYGPRPATEDKGQFTAAAFYEFPAFRIVTLGATVGLQKIIGGVDSLEDTYFRRLYGSVNAIGNTAVTVELQSASSQGAHSESGVAVGIRQSL